MKTRAAARMKIIPYGHRSHHEFRKAEPWMERYYLWFKR